VLSGVLVDVLVDVVVVGLTVGVRDSPSSGSGGLL